MGYCVSVREVESEKIQMDDFTYQEENQCLEENQSVEQKEIPKQRFPFSQLGIFYFCILVGTNLISIIIMAAFSFYKTIMAVIQNGDTVDVAAIMGTVSEIMLKNMALIMIIAYAITIPLCMLIVKSSPKYQNEQKEKWGISKLLLFVMISMGLMIFGNIVSQIGQVLLTLITGHQMTNPIDSILNSDTIVGSIILVVIVAPFVEEFLFRKVLIDRIRVYGDKITILLSGVLFGLFHGNLFQVVYATLLGMLLAYVYLKTNRIGYCIGLHMTVNIIGGVLPLLLFKGIDLNSVTHMQVNEIMSIAPQLLATVVLLMIEIACMIASIVVIINFRKKIVLSPGTIKIEKGQEFKTVCVNVGMILFLVVSIIIFIMNAMA